MYCEQCGAELEQNAGFCSTCGTRVGGDGANSPKDPSLKNVSAKYTALNARKVLAVVLLVMLIFGGGLLWMFRSEKFDISDIAKNVKDVADGDNALSRNYANTLLQQAAAEDPLTDGIRTGNIKVGTRPYGEVEKKCSEDYGKLVEGGLLRSHHLLTPVVAVLRSACVQYN